MNLKLKAALLTLLSVAGFLGLGLLVKFYPRILILSLAFLMVGALLYLIYLLIYQYLKDNQ